MMDESGHVAGSDAMSREQCRALSEYIGDECQQANVDADREDWGYQGNGEEEGGLRDPLHPPRGRGRNENHLLFRITDFETLLR